MAPRQTRRFRRPSLNVEALESRHLLAATADVVVLIDGSQGGTDPVPATSRFEFAAELVKVVDQKLISRGIGGQPDTDHDEASSDNYPEAPKNQFFVVEWGSNLTTTSEPVEPTHTIPPPPPPPDPEFSADNAAQDIMAFQAVAEGGNEDGWEAIHFASTAAEIPFRTNSAVHFLVVTDGPEHDPDPETLGPGLAHRRSLMGVGPYFDKTFDEILDSLKKEVLFDGNFVSDAVVTFVAGSEYREDQLDSFKAGGAYSGYDLLGADLNIQDEWDVDRAKAVPQGTPNDAIVFIYNGETKDATGADFNTNEINLLDHGFRFGDAIMFEGVTSGVLPGGLDETVVYYVTTLFGESDHAFQVSETIGGSTVDITSNEDLKVHVPAKAVKVTDDFTLHDHGSIDSDNLIGEDFITPSGPAYPINVFNSDRFDGELYGHLTWATGGTYWDMDLLFDPLNDINSPPVNMLMQAIADDMFQKIATQVADFDGDLFAVDTYGTYGLDPIPLRFSAPSNASM